jgi:hypothetical protein
MFFFLLNGESAGWKRTCSFPHLPEPIIFCTVEGQGGRELWFLCQIVFAWRNAKVEQKGVLFANVFESVFFAWQQSGVGTNGANSVSFHDGRARCFFYTCSWSIPLSHYFRMLGHELQRSSSSYQTPPTDLFLMKSSMRDINALTAAGTDGRGSWFCKLRWAVQPSRWRQRSDHRVQGWPRISA